MTCAECGFKNFKPWTDSDVERQMSTWYLWSLAMNQQLVQQCLICTWICLVFVVALLAHSLSPLLACSRVVPSRRSPPSSLPSQRTPPRPWARPPSFFNFLISRKSNSAIFETLANPSLTLLPVWFATRSSALFLNNVLLGFSERERGREREREREREHREVNFPVSWIAF